MPEYFEIRIRKEALKFAAAHMTVFRDGTKEALHGHQYLPTLSVRVRSANFENTLPFSDFKKAMKKIADEWDEKVLLAVKNSHFKRLPASDEDSYEFTLCKKRYVIPRDEIIELEVDNLTCEALAQAYHAKLSGLMKKEFADPNLLSVEVYIEESPGQGASFTHVK